MSFVTFASEPISIHALRGEGDCRALNFAYSFDKFQSTPSVGRATRKTIKRNKNRIISIHALRGEGDYRTSSGSYYEYNFNPRPPWGGRRNRESSKNYQYRISIHALRGEGDLQFLKARTIICIFQSTPSVGRATASMLYRNGIDKYFNPRPPWGGRRDNWYEATAEDEAFQSTPSVGRATVSQRAESNRASGFQSTPSVGRATINEFLSLTRFSYFNPRPPWGGRPPSQTLKMRP